jgi:hypothetical protein
LYTDSSGLPVTADVFPYSQIEVHLSLRLVADERPEVMLAVHENSVQRSTVNILLLLLQLLMAARRNLYAAR